MKDEMRELLAVIQYHLPEITNKTDKKKKDLAYKLWVRIDKLLLQN